MPLNVSRTPTAPADAHAHLHTLPFHDQTLAARDRRLLTVLRSAEPERRRNVLTFVPGRWSFAEPGTGRYGERAAAPRQRRSCRLDRAAATIANTSRPRRRTRSTTGESSKTRTRASTISTLVLVLRPPIAPFTAPETGFLPPATAFNPPAAAPVNAPPRLAMPSKFPLKLSTAPDAASAPLSISTLANLRRLDSSRSTGRAAAEFCICLGLAAT